MVSFNADILNDIVVQADVVDLKVLIVYAIKTDHMRQSHRADLSCAEVCRYGDENCLTLARVKQQMICMN